jgi:hypothetical protein
MAVALFVTTLLIAITGAVVAVSIVDARAVAESESLTRAFFLAEAGIDAGKLEVNENIDPDQDGVGDRSFSAADGQYDVHAQQLDPITWRLTSKGTAGSRSKTVQVYVKRQATSRFPAGAISVVGAADKVKFSIKKHPTVILDGADHPAVAFSDQGLADSIGTEFAEAVANGVIPPENLTGGVTSTYVYNGKDYELPIAVDATHSDVLSDIQALYDGLVDHVNNTLLPAATLLDGSGLGNSVQLGTKSAPMTVFLDGPVTRGKNEKIKGYGTLILNEILLDAGSELDWEGSVVVIGNTKKKAKLEVKGTDTNLVVNGNIVVLGEGTEDAEFKVKEHAVATVDGSVLIGSSYDAAKGKKAKFAVEKDGDFTLNGVITVLGSKAEAKFKEESSTYITGTLQMGIADVGEKDEIKLEMQGSIEIHKDDDAIRSGMGSWASLGVTGSIPEVEYLIDASELTTQLWTPLTE